MNQLKKYFYIVITICLCFGAFKPITAQNYKLINKDRTMTFARLSEAGFDSLFYFIKVDSIETTGSDSTFYFNKQLVDGGTPDCIYVNNDTTILGTKVLIQSDTDITYVFFNRHNDSIFIHTQIEIGDTWKVYKWSNGSYVKATVVNKLLRTVLPGIEDTLYRIQLNVFTLGGTMLVDTFPNATKIDISKYHGISEFFNFNIFPAPGDSIARVSQGLSNPYEGVVDVDAYRTFDFGLGYEFHYREITIPDTEFGADKKISAWKDFILGKVQNETSVTYTIERVKLDTLYFGASQSINFSWDTIIKTINYSDYAYLDTIEYNLLSSTNDGYSDWNRVDTIYNKIAYKTVYDWYTYDPETLCLSNPDDITMPEQVYGDGIGVTHLLDSVSPENLYALDLVYFQKGFITWGTPYDFSDYNISNTNLTPDLNLTIYPNPVKDILYMNSDLVFNTYEIIDVAGRLFKSGEIISSQLNIASLPSGVYFIKLRNDNQAVIRQIIKN